MTGNCKILTSASLPILVLTDSSLVPEALELSALGLRVSIVPHPLRPNKSAIPPCQNDLLHLPLLV